MSVADTPTRRGPNPCPNLNHRRSGAPVAHCPDCGGAVNQALHRMTCPEIRHDEARRARSAFCVHCGLRLIGGYR